MKYRVITNQGALTIEAKDWADALAKAQQLIAISGATLNAIGRVDPSTGKCVRPGWAAEE